MSLQPFFSYYGGKWRMAPRYERPRYDTIIERDLIGYWVQMATARPAQSRSSWSTKHAEGAFWGRATKARIASQLSKIRHWTIIEGTYADAPDIEATWFIDPPYMDMGKHYRCSADDINFQHLGAWCRSRRGQVMVCENEGAGWLPFRPFHTMGSAYGVTAEVIWTNDEAAA